MTAPHDRPTTWTWGICGLLLLASTINYMDRQTLANTATRVKAELEINNEAYGALDAGFGYAFAVGSLFFGAMADKLDVRWLYPGVLMLWSLAGVATGYVQDYSELQMCRIALGFFEAGHWPCALRTTQMLLAPQHRTLGNSVLQSGTSIGAIVTPLIILAMLRDEPGSWRSPFVVIGVVGIGWVILWVAAVFSSSHWKTAHSAAAGATAETSPQRRTAQWGSTLSRLAQLLVVVITINIAWHLLRVWLPLFLEEGRGYSERERLLITAGYNGFTDVGCILAGAATLWLHRLGWGVSRARVWVFGLCSIATAATLAIPLLPRGWALVVMLYIAAAGSLGLFPCYYAFTQEISARHQGKVFGILSTIAWLTVSPLQTLFGRYVDQHSGSYDRPMALAGALPLLGAAVLFLFWREQRAAVASTDELLPSGESSGVTVAEA